MQNAAETYGSIAQSSVSPRELEASLLVKAAMKLNAAKEAPETDRTALNDALTYNRRLWTLFASAVTDPESPLPQPVKDNIASLSVYIFNRTMEAMTTSAPEKLAVLIDINREVAAGLRNVDASADSNAA